MGLAGTLFGAVCCQPTGLLYVANLQVLWGLLERFLGLYVANLQVLWGLLERFLGLYVGNLQVSWGLLDPWTKQLLYLEMPPK